MTYQINGVSLHDPERGWRLLRNSTPVSALEYTSETFTIAGRDGSVPFSSTRGPVNLLLSIKSTMASRPALLALMTAPTLTVTVEDDPARSTYSATARLLSTSVETHHEALGFTTDSFILEIPEGCWRTKVTATTTPVSITSASQVVTLLSGISAPIQDALVRVAGPVTNLQIQDSGGSFYVVDGSIPAGSFVRIDLTTSRAWLTTSDTWTGGSELTAESDFGGPRGAFELTPNFTDPDTRSVRLTVTTTARATPAAISVRARNAYLF